jgi:hypothetical protein
MDKNTIVGLILIFVIFIGVSIFNNSQTNNAFEKTLAKAEASYAKGELETARTEFVNALNFKPNNSEVIEKINELNIKLGIASDSPKNENKIPDSSITKTTKHIHPVADSSEDSLDFKVFSNSAKGGNEFRSEERRVGKEC